MKRTLLIASIIVSVCSCKTPEKVEWVSTTNDQPWVKNAEVTVSKSVIKDSAIKIFVDSTKQEIDGFGGCFNELGWQALQTLPEQSRQVVYKNLFDTISGCRFNIYRMPIGANDYSVDWYSFNETDEDYEMKNFSIDRDKKRLIPYIKIAQSYNPDLKIWASPWCPPSWMKISHHYACSTYPAVNDLPLNKQGDNKRTFFRMEPKVLAAYALYFEKFVQGYEKEGIKISEVHVQNEIRACQAFPSCVWSAKDITTFLGKYLGPKFEADHIESQIWLGTLNFSDTTFMDSLLLDKDAARYIKGVGLQWGGIDIVNYVKNDYPALKIMQTETECGDGSNNWAAAEHTFDLMKSYFKNGANAYMYWNMVLDETGNSSWNWKQNAMITIEKKTGKVTYNSEYYLMKHLSCFVEPGSRFVTVSNSENCLAFLKNNQLVIVYYNAETVEKQTSFTVNEQSFTVSMKPKSFNTFKVKI